MYVSIGKSTRAGKKMMAIFYDMNKKKIKTTHFGQETASDYTIHGDIARKMNYLARHKEREDWEDYMSSGSLARWILWNKSSLTESIKDYMNRFKLKQL
tara:strand:+ start:156 stop:452 length:297 start_codon:yes stop_codon:yes gene_type:complete